MLRLQGWAAQTILTLYSDSYCQSTAPCSKTTPMGPKPCPYLGCRKFYPHHVFDRGHYYAPNAFPHPSTTYYWRSRCHHDRNPCCELCKIWEELLPPAVMLQGHSWHTIEDSFEHLHEYYCELTIGLDSDESYEISCRVEHLSQRIWTWCAQRPYWPEVVKLAEALRELAIEIQIGPPREAFYVMPKPRYLGGHFY
ncbi:hypothetical protein BDV96DRAFT_251371 [Lophiotrema nucula]|uniref:Uncharacterized protein n=1 Tax=Lophiotrema nucula TaxID=690887 RepID=A0A6A5YQ32_9PLEO|nr:hypothetical protein BDV96DRAFT_251371 [Lophiotrema nucula]